MRLYQPYLIHSESGAEAFRCREVFDDWIQARHHGERLRKKINAENKLNLRIDTLIYDAELSSD